MFASVPIPATRESLLQVHPFLKASSFLGFPSAVWRLPNSNHIQLLISVREGLQLRTPDLETLPSCFVIHPFEVRNDGKAYVLEGDLIFTVTDSGTIQNISNQLGDEHPLYKRLIEVAEKNTGNKENENQELNWEGLIHEISPDLTAKERYKQSVEKAISEIKAGNFAKIVLSRTKSLTYSERFDPFLAFKKLCNAYPSAFVSLVNLPEMGESWLGATPETLVSIDSEGIFKTTSLAATQLSQNNNTDQKLSDVRWGQKEIQEQALVSRYIVECFKKIRLREYYEKGPRTVQAGNLYHLRTDFEVDTFEVNFPELGSVMLKLLHPTSAVCGTPKEPALQFIRAVEGYDRSFYSGYLGPVKVNQETSLFVNLRTLRLSNGVATLFAGAGITEDSNPEREWEETDMKCDTLLRVLI